METQTSHIAHLLSEWLLAASTLLATFIITTFLHAILKRLHKDRGWKILRQLAPSISNILYVFGFKVFIDIAPLNPKLALWIDHGIYVLAVIIVLNLIQKAALVGLEWSALRAHNSKTLQQGFIPLLRNVITLFIFFSGGIMVLRHFNYDVMSFITALGVGSLAVGLAAKDTLSNMISGFILIIDRNLRPGDRINLTGSIGDVEEIGLRSTRIRMSDGNTLIVPNSDLVNTKILNLSLPTRELLCTTSVRIPYTASFSRVRTLSLAILNQVENVAKNKPMNIHLLSLSDGHQLIQIGFWVMDMYSASSTISEVNEKILSQLQQEGIQLISLVPSPFIPGS